MSGQNISLSTPTSPTQRTSTARGLVWLRDNILLSAIIVLVAGFLIYTLSQAIAYIEGGQHQDLYGLNAPTVEAKLTYGLFMLIIILLASLPLFLILAYTKTRIEDIRMQALTDMVLCGVVSNEHDATAPIDTEEIERRIRYFDQRNRRINFIAPAWLLEVLLVLFWSWVFGPRGMMGFLHSTNLGGEMVINGHYRTMLGLPEFVEFIVAYSSPFTWAFLGAYFYILASLMRRWVQSDLNVAFIWRANIRLLVIFVVAIVLTMTSEFWTTDSETNVVPSVFDNARFNERALDTSQRTTLLVAFMIGIVPDAFIYWLTGKVQAVLNINGASSVGDWLSGIFQPSTIQRDIDKLTFWQADRLAEEGIETTRDLANADLIDLLVNTRFRAHHLFNWSDQALLVAQRSTTLLPVEAFHEVGIWQASHLVDIWQIPDMAKDSAINSTRQGRLVYALAQTHTCQDSLPNELSQDDRLQLIRNLIENMVDGFVVNDNLAYIRRYWQNAAPEKRSSVLATLHQMNIAIDKQPLPDDVIYSDAA